jgi:hypothetical protein
MAKEVCAVLTEVLGRRISYRPLTIPQYQERLEKTGLSEFMIQHFCAVAVNYQNGVFSGEDKIIVELTGKSPMTVQDFVVRTERRFQDPRQAPGLRCRSPAISALTPKPRRQAQTGFQRGLSEGEAESLNDKPIAIVTDDERIDYAIASLSQLAHRLGASVHRGCSGSCGSRGGGGCASRVPTGYSQ